MLRKQYGSERAGQMLFGKTQKAADTASSVVNAAVRKEAIKRLAPMESTLPNAARHAIQQGIGERSGAEAWKYVTKAPNERAKDYLLSLLRGER